MNNQQTIPFTLSNTAIDYFELRPEYFSLPGAIVEKHLLGLSPGEYIKDIPELTIDDDVVETIVFNFQVGSGKSTFFYDQIEKYARKGFIIIVCSPFKKLVSKDYDYLQNRLNTLYENGSGISGNKAAVCNYSQLFSSDTYGSDSPIIQANLFRVHIMTINCFLGNPGDSAFEQNFYKTDYINNLFEAANDKNVVLFIDEIHASIENFRTEYFPKLLKWKGRIRKIFVASATYTPSVIPALNLLSLLTDKRLNILEAIRSKSLIQAKIGLNILGKPYSTNYAEILKAVGEKVISSNTFPVNIITATKAMAERIAPYCFNEGNIITENSELSPVYNRKSVNLLTSDTEIDYQIGQNNIGTTFKTGVDINDPNSLLIVVFPCVQRNQFAYGIYNDGISSIIQSIGRMRRGGRIELFIYEPQFEIGNESKSSKYFGIQKTKEEYCCLNDEYKLAIEKYKDILNTISKEVHVMEIELEISANPTGTGEAKENFGFWYPNVHEFLLRDRRGKLVYEKASFGKDISSYVLWACINDQFLNAQLAEISYYKQSELVININVNNFQAQFEQLMEMHKPELGSTTFRRVVDNLDKYFNTTIDKNGDVVKLLFRIEGDKTQYSLSGLLKKKIGYAKKFANLLLASYTGIDKELEKYSYFLNNIEQAAQASGTSSLADSYIGLRVLKNEFLGIVNGQIKVDSNGQYIPANLIFPVGFVEKAYKTLLTVIKRDIIIRLKVVSFMQQPAESQVPKALKNLFLNVTKDRKTISKKTYYKLGEPAIKEPDFLQRKTSLI